MTSITDEKSELLEGGQIEITTKANFMVNDPNLVVPEPITSNAINSNRYDTSYNDNGKRKIDLSSPALVTKQQNTNNQDKPGIYCTYDMIWRIAITILCLYSAVMVSYVFANMNDNHCDCNGMASTLQSNGNLNYDNLDEFCSVVGTCVGNITQTGSPTNLPTNNPTMFPTKTTNIPSMSPTESPSDGPTKTTNNPSVPPTGSPSINPTPLPSKVPSISPTNSSLTPTKTPILSPSISPTLITIEPTNNPSSNPSYIFSEGFTNIFASKLPYRSSCSGSVITAPLHLVTNYRIDITYDLMYNIEFRGYIYPSNKNFYIIASGYYRGSGPGTTNGLSRATAQYIINPSAPLVTLSYGISNTNHFEFILTLGNNWHASDITINKIGGSDCWHQRGNDIQIIDAYHA